MDYLLTVLFRYLNNILKWFRKNGLEILAITDNLVILNKPPDTKINSNNKNEVSIPHRFTI